MIGRDEVKRRLFWPKQLRVDDGGRVLSSGRQQDGSCPPFGALLFFLLVLHSFPPALAQLLINGVPMLLWRGRMPLTSNPTSLPHFHRVILLGRADN
jgi:hypothetical protein